MPKTNLTQKVKLYYLGGLPETGNPYVNSKGRAFVLPPVGGYLTLPRFNAEDLIKRNVRIHPNGRFSVFTYDARAAERAAHPQAEVVAAEQAFSREELLAMLADLDADKEPEPVKEDAAPSGRGGKKNKQAEAKPEEAQSDDALEQAGE